MKNQEELLDAAKDVATWLGEALIEQRIQGVAEAERVHSRLMEAIKAAEEE